MYPPELCPSPPIRRPAGRMCQLDQRAASKNALGDRQDPGTVEAGARHPAGRTSWITAGPSRPPSQYPKVRRPGGGALRTVGRVPALARQRDLGAAIFGGVARLDRRHTRQVSVSSTTASAAARAFADSTGPPTGAATSSNAASTSSSATRSWPPATTNAPATTKPWSPLPAYGSGCPDSADTTIGQRPARACLRVCSATCVSLMLVCWETLPEHGEAVARGYPAQDGQEHSLKERPPISSVMPPGRTLQVLDETAGLEGEPRAMSQR